MIWALDQVDQSSKSLQYPEDWSDEEISISEDMIADEEVKGVCYTTKCGESCRKGDHEASQMNGQPGSLSTMDRCPKNKFRRLCCNKGTTMGKCRWRGYRGLGLACTGGCADLETEITQNTNHHSDKEDQTCSGGTQSYCCAGFMPPISKEQMEEKIKDKAADAAIAAAESLALEVAAKAFCRIAITAALTPLTFIPIVGWIIRLAIQAAVPALANLCAKGIVKGGKSVFKFQGKDYDVKLDKPLTKKNDSGDRGNPDKADEKDSHCDFKDNRLVKRAGLRPISTTSTRIIKLRQTVTKTCNGEAWPQPCLHYRSVIRNQNGMAALTCTTVAGYHGLRPVVAKYSNDHNTKWINGWMQSPGLDCQRDEYPPAAIWRGRDMRQWIRLVPRGQNAGAGQLFNKLCPPKHKMSPEQNKRLLKVVRNCKRLVSKYVVTRTATTTVMKMRFTNMPKLANDGIPDNPCYPKTLIDDPGFALMTNDPWYNAHPASKRNTRLYRNPPGARIIAGKTNRPGYNKRGDEQDFDAETFNPDDVWVDEGNSTRKATDRELLDHLGFVRCENGDCEAELGDLGIKSLPFINPSSTVPTEVAAYATAVDALPTLLTTVLETASSIHEEARSLITPAPQLEYDYEVEYED
ncbi:hypothetical protein K456DRAFT_1837713 [Colletotrichum gloeosporioides 23]|nr:hypothetical protein K456DRAFT_1837713 [Colletotrichum gloeosporioides 23]